MACGGSIGFSDNICIWFMAVLQVALGDPNARSKLSKSDLRGCRAGEEGGVRVRKKSYRDMSTEEKKAKKKLPSITVSDVALVLSILNFLFVLSGIVLE